MLRKWIFLPAVTAVMLSFLACTGPSPERATPTPVPTATLEVANFTLPELIELRDIVGEVLAQVSVTANDEQRQLLVQVSTVLASIQPQVKLQDLVSEKTEGEQLILDFLGGIFGVGAEYFYKIPSPIAEAIAKGAEELGNRIAEWQVLGQLSFARITLPDTGGDLFH